MGREVRRVADDWEAIVHGMDTSAWDDGTMLCLGRHGELTTKCDESSPLVVRVVGDTVEIWKYDERE